MVHVDDEQLVPRPHLRQALRLRRDLAHLPTPPHPTLTPIPRPHHSPQPSGLSAPRLLACGVSARLGAAAQCTSSLAWC